VGADDAIDNDCSPVTVVLPEDDTNDDTVDFGFNEPCSGSIGDFVWNDLNRDGLQDEGEPGIPGVTVTLSDGQGVIDTTVTDANGIYTFMDLCAGEYIVAADTPPGFVPSPCNVGADDAIDNDCSPITVVLPEDNTNDDTVDFGFNEPPPPPSLCWLTAGGVKFEASVRGWQAELPGHDNNVENENNGNNDHGPSDSVGGVAYPSCSQFPGHGGNWNHNAHSLSLHLLGTDITVIRCGNVDGIEPGSESPVCDVNFIEFEGTGRVQGINGNHMDPIDVTFFVRAEDRNEPGNERSATEGEDIDRYFLRVADLGGNLVILVDEDGVDDGNVDPLTITGGNFQIHCTSCEEEDGGGGMTAGRDANTTKLAVEPGLMFLRGDSNTDGTVDISDSVYLLNHLFIGSAPLICPDAADVNNDGELSIGDPVLGLGALYLGEAIPAPYPEPGLDLSPDGLHCW
jgi:hypothetical protein